MTEQELRGLVENLGRTVGVLTVVSRDALNAYKEAERIRKDAVKAYTKTVRALEKIKRKNRDVF